MMKSCRGEEGSQREGQRYEDVVVDVPCCPND